MPAISAERQRPLRRSQRARITSWSAGRLRKRGTLARPRFGSSNRSTAAHTELLPVRREIDRYACELAPVVVHVRADGTEHVGDADVWIGAAKLRTEGNADAPGEDGRL